MARWAAPRPPLLRRVWKTKDLAQGTKMSVPGKWSPKMKMGQHEAMHFRKVKENVGEFGTPLFWAFGHRYAGSSLLICFAEWICMPRPAWKKKENSQDALDVPNLPAGDIMDPWKMNPRWSKMITKNRFPSQARVPKLPNLLPVQSVPRRRPGCAQSARRRHHGSWHLDTTDDEDD